MVPPRNRNGSTFSAPKNLLVGRVADYIHLIVIRANKARLHFRQLMYNSEDFGLYDSDLQNH